MIAGGFIGLGVIAGGITWFQMTPAERSEMMGSVLRILGWLGIVLVLPWATYFLTLLAAKRDNNRMAVMLILAYTAIEALVLFYLLGFHPGTSTAWVFVAVGILFAAGYNLLSCDFIADRLS